MELSLAALSGFQPKTGTLAQWNEAYVRVEDYLRAHRVHNHLHRSRLIEAVLERAARLHEQNPTADPTTLAAEEIERLTHAWFSELLGTPTSAQGNLTAQARIALLLADAPTRWPYTFLDTKNSPPEFREAMRKSAIIAGPDLEASNMVPREIDLGTLTEAAGETFETFDRWPVLRTLALWTVFLAALATLFVLTR